MIAIEIEETVDNIASEMVSMPGGPHPAAFQYGYAGGFQHPSSYPPIHSRIRVKRRNVCVKIGWMGCKMLFGAYFALFGVVLALISIIKLPKDVAPLVVDDIGSKIKKVLDTPNGSLSSPVGTMENVPDNSLPKDEDEYKCSDDGSCGTRDYVGYEGSNYDLEYSVCDKGDGCLPTNDQEWLALKNVELPYVYRCFGEDDCKNDDDLEGIAFDDRKNSFEYRCTDNEGCKTVSVKDDPVPLNTNDCLDSGTCNTEEEEDENLDAIETFGCNGDEDCHTSDGNKDHSSIDMHGCIDDCNTEVEDKDHSSIDMHGCLEEDCDTGKEEEDYSSTNFEFTHDSSVNQNVTVDNGDSSTDIANCFDEANCPTGLPDDNITDIEKVTAGYKESSEYIEKSDFFNMFGSKVIPTHISEYVTTLTEDEDYALGNATMHLEGFEEDKSYFVKRSYVLGSMKTTNIKDSLDGNEEKDTNNILTYNDDTVTLTQSTENKLYDSKLRTLAYKYINNDSVLSVEPVNYKENATTKKLFGNQYYHRDPREVKTIDDEITDANEIVNNKVTEKKKGSIVERLKTQEDQDVFRMCAMMLASSCLHLLVAWSLWPCGPPKVLSVCKCIFRFCCRSRRSSQHGLVY